MAKIVIALGGNALGQTPKEQELLIQQAVEPIVTLVTSGHQVIITHGNGPQVGMIQQAFQNAQVVEKNTPTIELAECTAMSQGYIGFHIQKALQTAFASHGINQKVATIITQVVVDVHDPAFENPTKPIGIFYTKNEAEKMMKEQDTLHMVEDSGRGWRRLCASPKPLDIVEKDFILDNIANNHVVIACGGGGVPIIASDDGYTGVAAVIDKDFASAKLATLVQADYLIILTAVYQVAIHFGTPNQTEISFMNTIEAKQYIEEGHFAAGSMLPKIEAALQFVETSDNGKVIISSLDKAIDALNGNSGTLIFQQ